MPAASGADTRAVFLWEDDSSGNHNFAGTPNDATYKTFGSSVTVDTLEGANNAVNQFDPGSQTARERIAQNFSGSWSISGTFANPWILKAVLSEASTSGTGPYTHTFATGTPWSMQIILGNEATTNERTLKGCVATSFTLETADNGEASFTMSGAYADESENSAPGSLVSQVNESFDALQFADGSLTLDATTFSLVQNVSLSIERNVDVIYELGSRVGVDYSPKAFTANLDWGKIIENDNQLTTMYGGSGSSPASRVDGDDEFSGSLTFDNGEAGGSQNKTVFNFTGVFPDTYGRSGTGDPTADYVENVSDYVRSISGVATNNTSTAK